MIKLQFNKQIETIGQISFNGSFLGVPVIESQANVSEVKGGAIVVKWQPHLEDVCQVEQYKVYYREIFSQANKGKWSSVTVNRNATSYILHLYCWKEYEIAVTSLNSYGESSITDSEVWKFRTLGGNF